jgi:hypothetical protein
LGAKCIRNMLSREKKKTLNISYITYIPAFKIKKIHV